MALHKKTQTVREPQEREDAHLLLRAEMETWKAKNLDLEEIIANMTTMYREAEDRERQLVREKAALEQQLQELRSAAPAPDERLLRAQRTIDALKAELEEARTVQNFDQLLLLAFQDEVDVLRVKLGLLEELRQRLQTEEASRVREEQEESRSDGRSLWTRFLCLK